MRFTKSTLVCAALLAVATSHAALIFNFYQDGNDVVATGSGTVNLSGLTFFFPSANSQVNLDAGSGNYRGGAAGVPFRVYFGISGPSNFGPGTGGSNFPSTSTGDFFGLTAFDRRLQLPDNYVSGAFISNESRWNNRTLANLGLAPEGSTFLYTWGSGANADSLRINIGPVPEPASMTAFALGAIALVRKRKITSRNT